MGIRVSEEQKLEILQNHKSGLSMPEIARMFGTSHQTISNCLRSLGVPSKRKPRKDKGLPRRAEEQLDLFSDSLPQKESKRCYSFTPLIQANIGQVNKASDQIRQGVAAYLPEVSVHGLQFNINLVIPALEPASMNYGYGKKETLVSNHIVDRLIEEFSRIQGFSRLPSKYRSFVAPVVLSNLYLAGKHRCQVTYSRDKNKQDHTVLEFIKFLSEAGYVINTIQPKQMNENDRYSSWCAPTKALLMLLNLPDTWSIRLADNHKPVIVRTKKNGRDETIQPKAAERRDYTRAGELVRRYNAELDKTDVRYSGLPIACYLHRIFNEDMKHGGRFYGAMHQTMPKAGRRAITIDGEPTTEIDYSAIHPNLLFWMADREAPEDVYKAIQDATGLDRGLVKNLLLRLLNSNSDEGFKRTVTKSGNPNTKEFAAKNPDSRCGLLEGYIEGVPDHYKGAEFIDSIKSAFPELTDFIGQDRLGVSLQWHDARIMEKVISRCLDAGFLCLPVHDSIIVPDSQKEAAAVVMREEFASYTSGRYIGIK